MNRKPKKNTCKTRLDKNYCEVCGFHKRGENHEAGEHHRQGEKNKGQCDPTGY